MRVVIATPLYPPEIGGPATHAVFCERELPKRGIDAVVVPFARVRHLPKGIAHLRYAWDLFRLARHADMIYALDPVSVGLPALVAARLSWKRLVLRVPGDYAWEQGVQRSGLTHTLDAFVQTSPRSWPLRVQLWHLVQSLVARQAHHVIVPSQYLATIVTEWGISPKRIKVVYSAFESHGAPGDEMRERVPVIVTAGRLVPWKGMPALIRAFAQVHHDVPDARLRIVGDGPERPALSRLVEELSLTHAVTLTGTLPQPVLYEELRSARIFALNTAYEGLSHLLLEAIDAGAAIITTPVGGNPEVIANGESGLLVAYNDQRAWECALLRLLTDHPAGMAFARQARRALSKFSSARAAEALAVILKQ